MSAALGAALAAGAVLLPAILAFMLYLSPATPLHHRGRSWDLWLFPEGGAGPVAANARQLRPVVYSRVWRIGPLVLARLTPSARAYEESLPPAPRVADFRQNPPSFSRDLGAGGAHYGGVKRPTAASWYVWEVWRVGDPRPWRMQHEAPRGFHPGPQVSRRREPEHIWRRTAAHPDDGAVFEVRPARGSRWTWGVFDGEGTFLGAISRKAE